MAYTKLKNPVRKHLDYDEYLIEMEKMLRNKIKKSSTNSTIIFLTGPPGSGKGIISKLLSEKQYFWRRYSQNNWKVSDNFERYNIICS